MNGIDQAGGVEPESLTVDRFVRHRAPGTGSLMILKNKRAWIADQLCSLGIVRLIERFSRRPGLLTLVYHRVGDPGLDPFYRPLISATPDAFENQMRRLRDAFRVISLDELIGGSTPLIDESGRLNLVEPTVLVTFDDGYRDNLTLAAPILKSLNLTATLFVTTGFVGVVRALPWWDRVAYAVQASQKSELALERPNRETLPLMGDRSPAIHRLIEYFIAAGWTAQEDELAHLEERAGIDPILRDSATEGLFLNVRQLQEWTDMGFSIGAHTETHRRLGGLDQTDLRQELNGARGTLESWLNHPVDTVAYPYGGPDSFDQRTQQQAENAGYRLGFALDPRVLRPGILALWSIPRFAVGHADTSNLIRTRMALASWLDRSRL